MTFKKTIFVFSLVLLFSFCFATNTRAQTSKDSLFIERLPKDPGLATTIGLAFPGGGQYYTERPVKGILITSAVAAGPIAGAIMSTFPSCEVSLGGLLDNPSINLRDVECTESDVTPLIIGSAISGVVHIVGAISAHWDAKKFNREHDFIKSTKIEPVARSLGQRSEYGAKLTINF